MSMPALFLAWYRLFMVVQALSPARVAEEDVLPLATDIHTACEIEGASLERCLAAAAWIGNESGGKGVQQSYGPGAACSAAQLEFTARAGHSCAELNADRVLAIRLWLRALDQQVSRCGSLRAGLGAISTANVCGGAPCLVGHRMAIAGI